MSDDVFYDANNLVSDAASTAHYLQWQ